MTEPHEGGPPQDESHNGGQGHDQHGEQPHNHERERHYETEEAGDERAYRSRERWSGREQSEMDASWGGVNLSVKGTMVVLAVIIIAGTGVNLWAIGQQNNHFDGILMAHAVEADRIKADVRIIYDTLTASKATLLEQHNQQVSEIDKNRFYLREIERLCMLTPAQREKLQANLPLSMRELLQRGESISKDR